MDLTELLYHFPCLQNSLISSLIKTFLLCNNFWVVLWSPFLVTFVGGTVAYNGQYAELLINCKRSGGVWALVRRFVFVQET